MTEEEKEAEEMRAERIAQLEEKLQESANAMKGLGVVVYDRPPDMEPQPEPEPEPQLALEDQQDGKSKSPRISAKSFYGVRTPSSGFSWLTADLTIACELSAASILSGFRRQRPVSPVVALFASLLL